MIKDNTDILVLLHTDLMNKIDVLDERYNCNNHRVMSLAIINGAYECIRRLVNWGADCQERESGGYSYLHMAAMSGHVNIFLYFLSKQVSLDARTDSGLTPFDLAEKCKNKHLIEYLRQKIDADSLPKRTNASYEEASGNYFKR